MRYLFPPSEFILNKNSRDASLRALIVSFILLGLAGCSSFGTNSKKTIAEDIQSIRFNSPSAQQRVIIYNHGIRRPQLVEPCYMPYNRHPRSLTALSDRRTMIYRLCSTATEAPSISAAGKQVYLRKVEINHAIDAFLSRGIQPKNIFLAGHSNGAWTALMMMQDVNKRFNGVIAFAPAFAGRRSEISFAPWWRNTTRPRQIKEMLAVPRMDALVFAYENDAFNRPQELQFLPTNYPLQSINGKTTGVDFVAYDCGLRNAHQTYRNDCRYLETVGRVRHFINREVSTWPDK